MKIWFVTGGIRIILRDMTPLLAFGPLGWPEILVILLLVLILFGAKKLPELARGLGQSLNEFKKARDEFETEIRRSAEEVKKDLKIEEPAGKQPAASPVSKQS